MTIPPHPGQLLRARFEALQLSITDAAKCLGVSRRTLTTLLGGRTPFTVMLALRLELAGCGQAMEWRAVQAPYELGQARQRADKLKVKLFSTRHRAAPSPFARRPGGSAA